MDSKKTTINRRHFLQASMGDNFWRYGFEANRKELELVMRYVHEQSLTKRQIAIEELFHPSTLKLMDG